ncbi:MAG: RNA polymerase factor sigma-54 [Candidatus Marinimicrobia bacterium]|nr:RNA polymerase factor sigma-54 [Candidatus Neomarinimicrobiota bacterium]
MPSQSLQQSQKLGLHLSPQQILQSSILQLTTIMLEERITEELEQNPALELSEPEATTDENDADDSDQDDIEWDEILDSPDDYNTSRLEDHSREHFEIQIAASVAFTEKLMEQLADAGVSEQALGIAEELMGNLNGEGYLSIDPLLIAERLDISEEEVEEVRRQIMRLSPAGIGALDLRECLLAQLEQLGEKGLAMIIVTDHFENFANRRYNRVMQSTGCNREELTHAIEVISRLNPKPGQGETTVANEYIMPDILIDEVDGQWLITLNDGSLPEMFVSPTYVTMARSKKKYDTETRQFARKKVEAAKWFMQAVLQRRETIKRVMRAILVRQEKFFRRGDGAGLKPMVLRDVAEDVQMDISTISRVTNGKYVQTPHNIYELKYFFTEGMTTEEGEEVSTREIKAALHSIIDDEDKRRPLNDERLASMLKDKGYPVARRTVAKYREQLKFPVARLRKEI